MSRRFSDGPARHWEGTQARATAAETSAPHGSLQRVTAPKAPVVLFWGEDAFLIREAALSSLGDLKPTEVDAGE